MKIELKNVKYSPSLSEETQAFTADVWLDGKKSLYVRNSGTGGGHEIHPYESVQNRRQVEDDFYAYCKTLPARKWTHDGVEHTIDSDAESVISDLLNEHLTRKEVKQALSKRICFTLKTKPGIFEMKLKYSPGIAKQIHEKRPDIDVILNELPIDDAVKLWLKDIPQ